MGGMYGALQTPSILSQMEPEPGIKPPCVRPSAAVITQHRESTVLLAPGPIPQTHVPLCRVRYHIKSLRVLFRRATSNPAKLCPATQAHGVHCRRTLRHVFLGHTDHTMPRRTMLWNVLPLPVTLRDVILCDAMRSCTTLRHVMWRVLRCNAMAECATLCPTIATALWYAHTAKGRTRQNLDRLSVIGRMLPAESHIRRKGGDAAPAPHNVTRSC
jgi:hypothetical protein